MGNNYVPIIIGFILFGIVMVSMIASISILGVNYNVSSQKMDEATGGAFDMEEYESQLLESANQSQTFRQRFESGDVDDVDDPSGIFSVAGDVVGVVTYPYKVLASVGKNIFGIPNYVTYAILSIINLTLLYGLWRLIRVGD